MNELQTVRDAVAVVAALHRGAPEEADLLLSLMSAEDRGAMIGSIAAIASACLDACDRMSPGAGTALLESLVTDLALSD